MKLQNFDFNSVLLFRPYTAGQSVFGPNILPNTCLKFQSPFIESFTYVCVFFDFVLFLACGAYPTPPQNGGADTTLSSTDPLPVGTTISYTCDNPTYFQLPATSAVCEAGGTWNPPTIGDCTRFSKL